MATTSKGANNDYDIEAIIEKCNDNDLPKFKIFRKFIYVLAGICYVSYSIYLIIQLATEYPMTWRFVLQVSLKYYEDYFHLLDVSEMDKAVRSSLDLGWNLIPGVIEHASLIKFKSSIYKSIPPRDVSAIIGLGPNYAITRRYDCIVNYFPFDQNPPPMPDGTNGYFSVAAGDFVKEEISEKRTTTILSTIASAGGAFGVIGAILVCLFGSRILDMWGFARKIAVNTWYWVDSLKRGWETLKRDWETLKRGWETLKNSCESDSDSQKNSNNTW
ncbi:5762_t:CDS:2 [Entrophospora sp. SA101]|nr:5762_t:CDS:2 [Entrophospora sp. SA101]